MAAQCVCQPLGAGYVDQGECQKNAADLYANAAESGRARSTVLRSSASASSAFSSGIMRRSTRKLTRSGTTLV